MTLKTLIVFSHVFLLFFFFFALTNAKPHSRSNLYAHRSWVFYLFFIFLPSIICYWFAISTYRGRKDKM